jgi:hypothetical protein
LRARHGAPLAIAAIPALVECSLAERLRFEPSTTVLVHGLAHRNHAGAEERKAEFGRHRPAHECACDAAQALALARAAFGASLRPVFVPPWNRMAPELAPALREIGFAAVSGFDNGRQFASREPLPRLDTHIDPIDWRGTRGLADPNFLVARLADRVARTAGTEPVGLLTHHLVHDAATWRFCEALLQRLALSPAAAMASIDDLVAAKESNHPESPQPAIVKSVQDGYTG